MDYRPYDNALGRFHSIDALSELIPGINPYQFGFNNPVFWSDPTGLFPSKAAAMEHIRKHGLQDAEVSYNRGRWEISSGEFSFWSSGGGDIRYQTLSGGTIFSGVIRGGEVNGDGSVNILREYVWDFNVTLGAVSAGVTHQAGFFQYNNLWHKTKSRGYSFSFQNKWKNPGAEYWRNQQVKKFAGARKFGNTLRHVGVFAIGGDVLLSGQVKPSHWINSGMLIASGTGFGSVVAAVWFIADFGTMGVNYLMGNGAKGLGDIIDNSSWGQNMTINMYEGFY